MKNINDVFTEVKFFCPIQWGPQVEIPPATLIPTKLPRVPDKGKGVEQFEKYDLQSSPFGLNGNKCWKDGIGVLFAMWLQRKSIFPMEQSNHDITICAVFFAKVTARVKLLIDFGLSVSTPG